MSSSVSRTERLDYILQSIDKGRFVSLREVAERFGVDIQTARRDISHLAEQSLVSKVHGGAVQHSEPDTLSVEERLAVNDNEKRLIAEAAAAMVDDGEVVFLDGGSTTTLMTPFLLGKRIHVVTNSLSIAGSLKRGWPDVEVILTGGCYYPKSELLLGPPAVQSIQNSRFNKAFLSAAGITAEGIYNANVLVVELEQAVIARANEKYLLADSSKLGRTSLVRVCDLQDITTLLTAGDIPDFISECSINCKVADR
ncbi:MAG: DeoR/GlpR family DNA-binding transcription regulator [Armatimonadota bacterium]|nr:DeoR/GlpR family DNA-binding transcription regulator [bacterium]